MSRKRSARSSKYAAPEMMYHVCRGKAVGDGMDYRYRLQRYWLPVPPQTSFVTRGGLILRLIERDGGSERLLYGSGQPISKGRNANGSE